MLPLRALRCAVARILWGLSDVYMDAHRIWTSDNAGHDDIFCRLVSDLKPVNCKDAAADR